MNESNPPFSERERANVNELFIKADLPKRHRVAALALDKLPDTEWGQGLVKCRKKFDQGSIIALLGPRGTGKTQMAVEICRDYCLMNKQALYLRAIDLFIRLRQCYRDDRAPKEHDIIRQLVAPCVLVIDEVQERGGSEWENMMLTYLVDKRYCEMKNTVLVGNIDPKKFDQELGPSIASRMKETGGIVWCDWPSFRV